VKLPAYGLTSCSPELPAYALTNYLRSDVQKKKTTISDTTITSKHDGTHLVTPQALIQSDITAAANLSII
jgi:hypothetical protein